MSDQFIVERCSPTLAGLKTGSLFPVEYSDRAEINREIRDLNRTLALKGLRAIPVRYTERFVLIYLYRPDYLKRDLEQKEAEEILRELGYSCGSTNRCVAELERQMKKLRTRLARDLRKKPPVADAVADADEEEIAVVRVKRYASKPMSVEDAILEMDMLGHSFYMFNNVETGRAATVYRRKDGGCGLIELENL